MKPLLLSSTAQTIALTPGEQAVINGAMVTAKEHCTLEVNSGAFVLTAPPYVQKRGPAQNPHQELYFSILEAGTDPARFEAGRFRLFMLLSQIVAQKPSLKEQKECTLCAAALISSDIEAATRSAALLASDYLSGHRNDRGETGLTMIDEGLSQSLNPPAQRNV